MESTENLTEFAMTSTKESTMAKPLPTKFLWMDLEMTGLDDIKHRIVELAAVITDLQFEPLEELHHVVYQPAEVLADMDPWCVKTHGASGLTARISTGTPIERVEQDLLNMFDRHFKKDFRIILCGNSIGNDRRFIDRYLPKVAAHLHYRMVDVSSFKEIFREKYGVQVKKENKHRAIEDVYASILELKTYLNYVQIPSKL